MQMGHGGVHHALLVKRMLHVALLSLPSLLRLVLHPLRLMLHLLHLLQMLHLHLHLHLGSTGSGSKKLLCWMITCQLDHAGDMWRHDAAISLQARKTTAVTNVTS